MTIDYRIKDILRRQTRAHVIEIARRRQDAYWAAAEICESPIERLLLAPLMFISPLCLAPRYEGPLDLPSEARLHAQHRIAGYRADFAYIVKPFRDERTIRIAIECDGHDYHSTRDQREDDAARGNAIQGAGYTLMRFTGSQINQRPEGCAQDVADQVDRLYAQGIHEAVNANCSKSDDEDAA
ncbi:MAG: DUF559 domain-containing protein [Alphaproteobacteria bacterium]|nr:DUF559 domain-containing protein [Alphaproteobacteria bacterium]